MKSDKAWRNRNPTSCPLIEAIQAGSRTAVST